MKKYLITYRNSKGLEYDLIVYGQNVVIAIENAVTNELWHGWGEKETALVLHKDKIYRGIREIKETEIIPVQLSSDPK